MNKKTIALNMNKKNLDIAYFLSFCIEQYKEAKHLHGAEAAKIFSQYGVLKYLEEHLSRFIPKAANGFWKISMSLLM